MPDYYGKSNPDVLNAYIMLIRLRHDLYLRWQDTGIFPDEPGVSEALNGHSNYWAEQLREGRMLFGGGMEGEFWDNVAMIVFSADSLEEAETIVNNDPAVKSYVFQAQVRPFRVNTITNKFCGA